VAVCLLVGAVSFAFIGACLILAPAFEENTLIIPYMPYISGAILGVSVIALGVLLGIFSIYVFALIKKTTAAFAKRQKKLLTGRKALPYTVFPLFEGRARRAVRRVTLAALAVFAVCFTAAFLLMTVQAGSLGFWHVWGWFNYIG
jgi:uncharacterized membrane protein